MANDTPFGLAAYLCSTDPATIARAGRGIEAGWSLQHRPDLHRRRAVRRGQAIRGSAARSRYGIEEYLNLKYLCHAGL